MKSGKLASREVLMDLFIIISFVLIATFSVLLFSEGKGIDIQFHDTYVVIDTVTFVLLLITPFIFITFLIKGIIKKFKTPATNLGLLIGIILSGYFVFGILRFQQSYKQELVLQIKEYPSDYNRAITIVNKQMIFTWGTIGMLAIGFGALAARTFKLPSTETSS